MPFEVRAASITETLCGSRLWDKSGRLQPQRNMPAQRRKLTPTLVDGQILPCLSTVRDSAEKGQLCKRQ